MGYIFKKWEEAGDNATGMLLSNEKKISGNGLKFQ